MYGINNARDLIKVLELISEESGTPLNELQVNFRKDYTHDITPVNWIAEDLYDKETNSRLTSVILLNDDTDDE